VFIVVKKILFYSVPAFVFSSFLLACTPALAMMEEDSPEEDARTYYRNLRRLQPSGFKDWTYLTSDEGRSNIKALIDEIRKGTFDNGLLKKMGWGFYPGAPNADTMSTAYNKAIIYHIVHENRNGPSDHPLYGGYIVASLREDSSSSVPAPTPSQVGKIEPEKGK